MTKSSLNSSEQFGTLKPKCWTWLNHLTIKITALAMLKQARKLQATLVRNYDRVTDGG